MAKAEPLLQARFHSLQGPNKPTSEQLKQVAQDFEGVLLEKLMQEMQNTIPDSGMFSGPGMKQIQGMFWSFLSEQVAQNGGIGLADSLYRDLCLSAGVDPEAGAKHVAPPRQTVTKYLDTMSEPTARMELKR
jgi:flagellar protein FlgJ